MQTADKPLSEAMISDDTNPDSKVQGVNMGTTWVLPAPDGPHVGPMNLSIRECLYVSLSIKELMDTSLAGLK